MDDARIRLGLGLSPRKLYKIFIQRNTHLSDREFLCSQSRPANLRHSFFIVSQMSHLRKISE